MEEPTTLEICRQARRIDISDIPPSTVAVAKNLIRDGLGVMIAGMKHSTINMLAEHVKELGCKAVSPVYGYGFSTAPQEAAFVNGAATHVLDFEPMFSPPTHVVSPILAGLLALAHEDHEKADGEKFLKAFIAGVQLQADLRKAAKYHDAQAAKEKRHFPFQKQGFHPPGTVGALGSALGAGLWLGLDEEQLSMAIGIAASRSSGLAGNIGTMTKSTHCGHASRVGVESALLAKKGFTASIATFEGASGWGQVYGGDYFDRAILLHGMTELNCFVDPGFAFKKWPAHTAMQVAIEASIPLFKDGWMPEFVRISSPIFKYCNRPSPRDSDECRFSFQYNVALGILDGNVNFSSYTNERLHKEDMQTLLRRITLDMDPEIETTFGKMEVKIVLNDGRSSSSDRWPGHWKSPATDEGLQNKFKSCAGQLYSSNETVALSDCLLNIETEDNFQSLLSILSSV